MASDQEGPALVDLHHACRARAPLQGAHARAATQAAVGQDLRRPPQKRGGRLVDDDVGQGLRVPSNVAPASRPTRQTSVARGHLRCLEEAAVTLRHHAVVTFALAVSLRPFGRGHRRRGRQRYWCQLRLGERQDRFGQGARAFSRRTTIQGSSLRYQSPSWRMTMVSPGFA